MVLRNVPRLKDVETMGMLLQHLEARFLHDGEVRIDTSTIAGIDAPYDLVRTMRASVLVLGPLLARMGEAVVSLPGGCAIGARPINLHLMGLEKMGATITLEQGYVRAKARRLKGASIYFDMPTVTGTENLMMAASLADGLTVLENAACEPEVSDLANALNKMGASIEGAGTTTIRIEGVNRLNPIDYAIIPDRIETGTFMAAAGITGGKIRIKACRWEHLDAIIMKLTEAGIEIEKDGEDIIVRGPERLAAVNVKTMPYPGFPTDMQAQFMAMMSIADGTSVITENIFENRFMHVSELMRMGANIIIDGATATVNGIPFLRGAPVMATDLRASASLIIAGLVARGETHVSRIYHLDRGYDAIERKLRALGADIERAKES